MIEKIKNGLKKRKVKVFLVFLLCSTLAWFISKLSERYTSEVVVDLSYVNTPNDQMLIHASHDKIKINIEGGGFQFLGFSIRNKTVEIDLSSVKEKDGEYFIPKKEYKSQIEKQMKAPMKLLEIKNDTLFFNFQEVITKKVPVKPQINLSFVRNYLLDGILVLKPDSITIKGPRNEVDIIFDVKSSEINLKELTSDFSKKINLIRPAALQNTYFSDESVTVKGKVSKFSEKNIKIKIEAIHLPENTSLKMFPNTVTILCKGSLAVLKELSSSDFEVVVDYRKAKNGGAERLPLVIQKQPTNLQSTILQEIEIEYILERI